MNRLLLDQGLPRSSAALLSQIGWDVVHVAEIGMSRATDAEVLQRARAEARICVTLDADFHALLAVSGERAPSVIRIRKQGLDAAALAALLRTLLADVGTAFDSGVVVTVTDKSVRTRRLPIGAG